MAIRQIYIASNCDVTILLKNGDPMWDVRKREGLGECSHRARAGSDGVTLIARGLRELK